LHNGVHHLCKIVQSLVTTHAAPIDSRAPQLSTYCGQRVATYRRQEVGKLLTSTHCRSGTKRVPPEEVKWLVAIGSSAILVLAVHDALFLSGCNSLEASIA
jgi:hypothetical protein